MLSHALVCAFVSVLNNSSQNEIIMKSLNKLFIGAVSFIAFVSLAFAAILQIQTPLCSDNQSAFISLDDTSRTNGFFTCYTKPEAFE